MHSSRFRLVSAIISVMLGMASVGALAAAKTATIQSEESQTLFGFTPFPYDFTLEAVERTHAIIVENSSIYGVHIDDAIPWEEALADAPFPASLEQKWNDIAKGIPSTHPVYLGLTPLGKDRVNIGAGLDDDGKEVNEHAFTGRKLNNPDIQKAYLNYVRRAVKLFKPRYLNIGIEVGEMAARKSSRWPEFEKLFDFVKTNIKKEFPNLLIGVSFGLQSMQKPEVAQLVKPLVENSDYVCLSFYPYASEFSEKFGAPALPSGKAAWQKPLAWISAYTTKPVAICETGYSTQNVELKQFDLKLYGDSSKQAEYVGDLIDIAKRNKFLFVIWYLAVDYDKLYAKMPKGSEVNLLWRNIGLFDGDVHPKPAWNIWKSFKSTPKANPPLAADSSASAVAAASANVAKPAAAKGKTAELLHLGFETGGDLFICPGDSVKVDGKGAAMHWEYEFSAGQWKWCAKDISNKSLASAVSLDFKLRSDMDGPLFIKLEEKDKEAFYAIINPTNEWVPINLKLADLAIDPDTRQNGKLDMDNIATIIIADPGSTNSTPGRRHIWIGDLNLR